jgi:hypothetical protein
MGDVATDDDEVDRAIAHHLIGDVSVSTLDIPRLWLAEHSRPRANVAEMPIYHSMWSIETKSLFLATSAQS